MSDKQQRRKSKAVPCQDVAFTVLDVFLDRLLTEAGRAPFGLDAAAIRTIARTFREDQQAVAELELDARFEACMKQREQEIWDQTRKNAFERVLIKRFSALFPAEGELATDSNKISRRIIPGFLLGIGMMAGEDYFEQCRRSCKEILRAKRQEAGRAFHWSDLYDDPGANRVIDDVLATVAPHFRNFEHRVGWMHKLISEHLAMPEDYAFEGEGVFTWDVDDRDVRNIVRFLYHRLLHGLGQPEGRTRLAERYPPDTLAALEELQRNLYGGS